MNPIYKILKLDPKNRTDIIVATSALGIAVNLAVSAAKIVVGLIASSIAIISEGLNNASDVFSAVVALLGTKLAQKHPDEKHPFGYGRIEYIASLVVSAVIIVTGVQMTLASVERIFSPTEISTSYLDLAILFVSACIKLALGVYTQRAGKRAHSTMLEGVGKDCINDTLVSAVTIASVLLFIIFHINIDAYAGVVVSIFIVKVGVELATSTISEILGRPGQKEVAAKIYSMVNACPAVLGAADMILHNYGPDAYSGSVNLEVDHEMTVGEIYQILHKLQLDIMHEMNVTMVFGIYAVDNDHEDAKQLRADVIKFMKNEPHIKSFHAIYIEPESQKIYVDFIVDYQLDDWDGLECKFCNYMAQVYPKSEVELTIETAYV